MAIKPSTKNSINFGKIPTENDRSDERKYFEIDLDKRETMPITLHRDPRNGGNEGEGIYKPETCSEMLVTE